MLVNISNGLSRTLLSLRCTYSVFTPNSYFNAAIVFMVISTVAYGQVPDSLKPEMINLPSFDVINDNAIYAGYTYSSGDTAHNKNKYHIIELGLWQTQYMTRHPTNKTYYAGSEFVLNSERFVIGPKVGAYFSALMFCFGTEAICYTDFHEAALRWGFYGGIGFHTFKLTVGVQAKIINTDFNLVNIVNINFSIQLYTLSSRNKARGE